MIISRKTLVVVYLVSMLLLGMATVLFIIDGNKLPTAIFLLLIVFGTIGFIRLMKDKTK